MMHDENYPSPADRTIAVLNSRVMDQYVELCQEREQNRRRWMLIEDLLRELDAKDRRIAELESRAGFAIE